MPLDKGFSPRYRVDVGFPSHSEPDSSTVAAPSPAPRWQHFIVRALAAAGPFFLATAAVLHGVSASLSILEVLVPLVGLGLLPVAEVEVAARRESDPRARSAAQAALAGLALLFGRVRLLLATLVALTRQLLEVLTPAPALAPALAAVRTGRLPPSASAREARARPIPRLILTSSSRSEHAHACLPRTREGIISTV